MDSKNPFQMQENSFSQSLREALKNNLMDEQKYQKWASAYYKMPILKADYFTQHPTADTQLWEKLKDQNVWNPSLIPLYEQDQILYVACLEPAPQIEKLYKEYRLVFVLVSIKHLSALWEDLTQKNAMQTAGSSTAEPKDVTQTSSLSLDDSSEEDILPLAQESSQPDGHNDSSEEKNTPSEDQTAVIEDSLDQAQPLEVQTDESSPPAQDSADSEAEEETGQIKNAEEEGPSLSIEPEEILEPENSESEGSVEDSPSQGDAPAAPNTEDADDLELLLETNTGWIKCKNMFKQMILFIVYALIGPPPMSSKQQDSQPVSFWKKSKKRFYKAFDPHSIFLKKKLKKHSAEKPPAQTADSTSKWQKLNLFKKSAGSPPPKPITKNQKVEDKKTDQDKEPVDDGIVIFSTEEQPDSPKEESDSPPLSSTKKEAPVKEQEIPAESSTDIPSIKIDFEKMTAILEDMEKHFNSYVLFVFKNKKFIPYKWSSHLEPKNKHLVSIDKPSLFKVCYRTKQPYCGPVASTITNNTFFENWNLSPSSQSVILIPFLNNSVLMGGYLGISGEQNLSLHFLETFQKRIKPLANYFKDDSILKNAA